MDVAEKCSTVGLSCASPSRAAWMPVAMGWLGSGVAECMAECLISASHSFPGELITVHKESFLQL